MTDGYGLANTQNQPSNTNTYHKSPSAAAKLNDSAAPNNLRQNLISIRRVT
ncbi:MAG: hypothetical protein ABSG33_09615 [Candidatus Bathyarchaeia archaeon]